VRSTNAIAQCRKPLIITFPGYSLHSTCKYSLHATYEFQDWHCVRYTSRTTASGSSLASEPLSGHLNVAKYCYVGTAWVEPFLNSAEGKWIGFMLAVNCQWTNDNWANYVPRKS